MVSHVLLTSHLDHYNVLYMGLALNNIQALQLRQNGAGHGSKWCQFFNACNASTP